MKTLADFKQEVAEKYGYKNWRSLEFESPIWTGERTIEIVDFCDEAAELYAEYKEEQMMKIPEEQKRREIKEILEAVNPKIDMSEDERQVYYDMGWNAAVNSAVEIADDFDCKIVADEILTLKK